MDISDSSVQLRSFTLCRNCLQSDDVIWRCRQCKSAICIQCKGEHVQNHPGHELFRNDSDENSNVSTGTCFAHSNLEITELCVDCNAVGCTECIEESHKEHDVKSVSETLKYLRFQMEESFQNLEKQLLRVEELIRAWARNASEYFDVFRGRRNLISNRFAKFESIPKLNQILVEELQKYDQDHKPDMDKIQYTRVELEAKHADIKQMISKLEEALETDGIEFIMSATSLLRQLSGFANILPSLYTPQCRELNMRLLDSKICPLVKMLESTSIKMDMVNSFAVDFTPHQVVPVSTRRAWVGASPDGRLSNFSLSGDERYYLDTGFKIHDFKVLSSGALLCTVKEWTTDCLKKIEDRNKISTIVDNFHPYESSGLCINDMNQVVVCLKGPHGGKIGIYNQNSGTVITEIHKKAFGVSLFSKPIKVVQNYQGDYHVIDEKDHVIVTVNREGVYMWTYNGKQGEMHDKGYCPKDLCCDPYLNIITTDVSNDVIHVTNRFGQYITHLDTSSLGLSGLHALSIDNDSRLWMSTYFQKKIYVIEYLKEKEENLIV